MGVFGVDVLALCSFHHEALSFLLTAVPSRLTFTHVTFCGLSGKTNLVPVIQSCCGAMSGLSPLKPPHILTNQPSVVAVPPCLGLFLPQHAQVVSEVGV